MSLTPPPPLHSLMRGVYVCIHDVKLGSACSVMRTTPCPSSLTPVKERGRQERTVNTTAADPGIFKRQILARLFMETTYNNPPLTYAGITKQVFAMHLHACDGLSTDHHWQSSYKKIPHQIIPQLNIEARHVFACPPTKHDHIRTRACNTLNLILLPLVSNITSHLY